MQVFCSCTATRHGTSLYSKGALNDSVGLDRFGYLPKASQTASECVDLEILQMTKRGKHKHKPASFGLPLADAKRNETS